MDVEFGVDVADVGFGGGGGYAEGFGDGLGGATVHEEGEDVGFAAGEGEFLNEAHVGYVFFVFGVMGGKRAFRRFC